MTGSNIASSINDAHAAVQAAKQEGVRHAIECGRLLAQAKETVAHGGWDRWISDNCTFSMRTAQLYMRVASHVGDDPAKAQRVADLSLRELGRTLAERSSPPKRAVVSDETLRDEHRIMGAWLDASPAAREKFRAELAAEAIRQGVPAAQVQFGKVSRA